MNGQMGSIAVVNLPENCDVELFVEKFKDIFEHVSAHYEIYNKDKIINILRTIQCNLIHTYDANGVEQCNNYYIAMDFLDEIGFLLKVYYDFCEYHGMIINMAYRGEEC
jgi:hypothetical protein